MHTYTHGHAHMHMHMWACTHAHALLYCTCACLPRYSAHACTVFLRGAHTHDMHLHLLRLHPRPVQELRETYKTSLVFKHKISLVSRLAYIKIGRNRPKKRPPTDHQPALQPAPAQLHGSHGCNPVHPACNPARCRQAALRSDRRAAALASLDAPLRPSAHARGGALRARRRRLPEHRARGRGAGAHAHSAWLGLGLGLG